MWQLQLHIICTSTFIDTLCSLFSFIIGCKRDYYVGVTWTVLAGILDLSNRNFCISYATYVALFCSGQLVCEEKLWSLQHVSATHLFSSHMDLSLARCPAISTPRLMPKATDSAPSIVILRLHHVAITICVNITISYYLRPLVLSNLWLFQKPNLIAIIKELPQTESK